MFTPSMPLALTCATVFAIVTDPRCSAEHMLGVPFVESIMMIVSTTFVPLACAVLINPGTGPLGSFQIARPESSLKPPVQSTCSPK